MLFARIFKLVIFIAFVLNVIFLFIAISSPWFNPKYFWLPALFGLFFKLFLAIHLFFILIFFIGRLKRLIWISFIFLLFSFPAIIHASGLWLFGPKKMIDPNLKLMTYNIDNFDYYSDTISSGLILKVIQDQNPSIICFQEYLRKRNNTSIILKIKALGYKYYYENITEVLYPGNHVGQAIFSKLPFYNPNPIHFKNTSNGAFSVDIPFDHDTFRLYNVHFQSIGLRDNELKIPSSIKDFEAPQKWYYKMLFIKIRTAFRKRSYQSLKVKELADRSPYKVILCGDFNDTPLSFLYKQLTEKLDDTYLRTGFGFGSTYSGIIPLQRIDYILADPRIKTDQTKVLHVSGSDHYPVVTNFSLH